MKKNARVKYCARYVRWHQAPDRMDCTVPFAQGLAGSHTHICCMLLGGKTSGKLFGKEFDF